MIRQIKALLVIGVVVALAGCASTESTPALVDPTTFVTYVHPSGVFTLNLPPDWVVNDASTDYAINVEFSPPNSAEPLVGMYVVSLSKIVGPAPTPVAPDIPTLTPPLPDLSALATVYERAVYASGGTAFQESARDTMPDGSLRVKFFLSSDGKVSQHNDFVQIIGPYLVALRTRLPEDSAQFRTVSRIINTMTINPFSAWSSAIENEDTGQKDAVGFTGLNAWMGSSGGFQIAGQAINNAPDGLEFVQIHAQLYDAENRLLAQRDDFVSSDVVLPGQGAPFLIVFTEGMPPGMARYELHASARYVNAAAPTFYGPENFVVTTQSGVDENGWLVLRGQATNQGSATVNLVKVIVTLFDDQQRVIATGAALVDQQPLEPGQAANYSVTFAELGGAPSGFIVNVEGVVEQ